MKKKTKKKKKKLKKERNILVRDMILTRKGGPMKDRRKKRDKEKENYTEQEAREDN